MATMATPEKIQEIGSDQEEENSLVLVTRYPESYNRKLARLDYLKRIAYSIRDGFIYRAREYPLTLWYLAKSLLVFVWRTGREFVTAIWTGHIYPLKVEISDSETRKSSIAWEIFTGRLLASGLVSMANGLYLVTVRFPILPFMVAIPIAAIVLAGMLERWTGEVFSFRDVFPYWLGIVGVTGIIGTLLGFNMSKRYRGIRYLFHRWEDKNAPKWIEKHAGSKQMDD